MLSNTPVATLNVSCMMLFHILLVLSVSLSLCLSLCLSLYSLSLSLSLSQPDSPQVYEEFAPYKISVLLTRVAVPPLDLANKVKCKVFWDFKIDA